MSSSSVRNDGVGVDMISHLPDSILIHILSLLPTHDVLATSLLSKKWKFLWKNIFNLTFDDLHWRNQNRSEDDSSTSFAYFVNKVLTSLNEQCIQRFSLRIHKNYKQYDVSSWISAAISKNAKYIMFIDEDSYLNDIEMPGSLYTCKTLEFLRLSNCNLILPSLISLPNLKTLGLQVSRTDPVSISKLVSGCSSLKTLVISGLSINVHTFTISSPTLRKLYLVEIVFNSRDEESKIVINAPQLRYLNVDDVNTRSLSIENLCLLDEAHINLYFNKFYDPLIFDHYSKTVLKKFQGLYNVSTLSLGLHTFKALSHGGVIPRFSKLSNLTVQVGIQLKSLINLLESCNELQSLTLTLDKHYYKEVTCWSKPEKVPICFLSSLHTISMHGIKDHVFEMISYVLENAKVLTTMKLQAYDVKANEKLLQEIPNFRKGSEKCEVIYLNPMK